MASGQKKLRKQLNSLIITEVKPYIAMNKSDFELYSSVIKKLSTRLHQTMKTVDPYYKKYTKKVSFAGSHYDNLRITKPDEFDIVFSVGLPLNMSTDRKNPDQSDIVILPQDPGFVELKMGVQFEKLPVRSEYDINKTAYEWGDDEGYLLRSKFKDWFKGVLWKALAQFESSGSIPVFTVKGRRYTIRRSEAGPALTLIVEDELGFKMDVDLVPALRFPEDRWPIDADYRPIPPGCKKGQFWMVVPKPNKNDPENEEAVSRTWRLGLQYQEGALMHDKHFLKPTIRLIKKLRDTQGMDKLASYHIKTIFFNELLVQPPRFWVQNLTIIFKHIVGVLYRHLSIGKINYFWNDNYDFLENVDRSILNGYCNKLEDLMTALESPPDVDFIAKFLLTSEEYERMKI